MAYLIFVIVAVVGLIGFFILSDYETRRGTRVFADERMRLDEQVQRVEFILANVDLAALVREESHRIIQRIIHDATHISLSAVRSVERLLTRLIKRIHMERTADTGSRENAREFVKTLSDFKEHLEITHPDVPDVY